jgi:hypothetical protein
MNRIATLLGSVALSLLTSQAMAVRITSSTIQSGQKEGQSVSVSVGVDWELPPPANSGIIIRTNPLYRDTKSVTVALTGVPGITAFPKVPLNVTLTQDASGLYQGTFTGLPADSYSATITATHSISDATHIPSTFTTTSATASKSFHVGLPAGCFGFPLNNLQGFTVQGFFDHDSDTIVAAQAFNPQSSPVGFSGYTSPDGAFFLNLVGTQPPAQSQVHPDYRFDIRSADLSTNADWQNITGVSYRQRSTDVTTVVSHAVVHVRKPDGTLALFRQTDPNDADPTAPHAAPLVAQLPFNIYNTVVDRVQPGTGSTVTGVDIRMIATPGTVLPNVFVDLICPRHD